MLLSKYLSIFAFPMPLPNYDTPEMLRLSQKTLDFKATAGLSAVPDAAKLQECIAMSLTRLQLVFLHLPEKDDERLKFMAGLECEMVRLNQTCHHA